MATLDTMKWKTFLLGFINALDIHMVHSRCQDAAVHLVLFMDLFAKNHMPNQPSWTQTVQVLCFILSEHIIEDLSLCLLWALKYVDKIIKDC